MFDESHHKSKTAACLDGSSFSHYMNFSGTAASHSIRGSFQNKVGQHYMINHSSASHKGRNLTAKDI